MIEPFEFSTISSCVAAEHETFHAWRQHAFPFFVNKTFLTHASVSPLPKHAQEALQQYATHICEEGQFDHLHNVIYKRCKERIATLLQANSVTAAPSEIAFASSTSHALGLVATALPWQAGENCVVADGDFPANVTTWKNLEHTHGITVRMVPFRPQMDISLEDIMPLVDEKTRIVSLASCNFLSGFPPNLKEIGSWLHARGVLLCVDAIQTLGAVRCDFSEVDFICADAHKWLLGPNGIALLWTRKEVLQTLRPAIFGWLAAEDRANWFAYDTTPIASAERFEPGARNYLGIVGMEASLEVLQSHDASIIENRIVKLRNCAAELLQTNGLAVLWSPTHDLKSGIVSFRAASDTATTALYRKLDEKFALSLRADKNGTQWIRVSAHYMNCEEDIEALLKLAQSN